MRFLSRFIDYLLALGVYILLNVVFFHGGYYRLICEPDSYSGNVYGRLTLLREAERRSGKRAIALLGDSTTREGIDSQQLTQMTGSPAANLALPGTTPREWLYFLRSVDPDRDRFEVVVLTVPLHSIRLRPDPIGFQTLIPVAKIRHMIDYISTDKEAAKWGDYYAAIDRLYAFRNDLKDLLLSPERLLNLRRARTQQLQDLWTYKGKSFDVCDVDFHPPSGKIRDWGAVRDPEIQRMARNNFRQIARLNERPAVLGLLDAVREIVDYYKNSSTKLVIVSIPAGMGHTITARARPLENYLTGLNTLAAEPNVWHWSGGGNGLFQDCRHFYDFRHLNSSGRRVFTSWLAERLQLDSVFVNTNHMGRRARIWIPD